MLLFKQFRVILKRSSKEKGNEKEKLGRLMIKRKSHERTTTYHCSPSSALTF